MKRSHLVVTFAADLRPLVEGVNSELVVCGAEPVRPEELALIDTMLHESLAGGTALPARCGHCGGFVCLDTIGDHTCLNCGRPVRFRGSLAEVIQEIAQGLIDRRAAEKDAVASATTPGQASVHPARTTAPSRALASSRDLRGEVVDSAR